MDRCAYSCIGDGQTSLPQPWVQDRITNILEKTVNNVLEGHMLKKYPREQVTNKDVPDFFQHTNT
jgi:hypothetical protein